MLAQCSLTHLPTRTGDAVEQVVAMLSRSRSMMRDQGQGSVYTQDKIQRYLAFDVNYRLNDGKEEEPRPKE